MEDLNEPIYSTIVIATNKHTKRPGTFFDVMQQAATEPISLRALIEHLYATYQPPRTKKDPEMVIRVRTRDAYTRLGYLKKA